MKKVLLGVLGLGFLAGGLVYAACMGPFCWDDTGAAVTARLTVNGMGGCGPFTLAQTTNTIAVQKGQCAFCTDCIAGGGAGTVCIATGTANSNQFVLSTGTVCK